MRAAVLGAGGLGRTITLELASDRRVTEIVLMDRRGHRSQALQRLGRKATIVPLEGDVTDPASLRRALRGACVAVNATLPEYNLDIMKACLDEGCGYVDTSAASSDTAGGPWGILDQLDLDEAWRARGVTAIVSMGSDPGLSNVMARIAADRFVRIDAIRIRWAASGAKGIEGYPLYSREMFLQDALASPVVWDGERIAEKEIASGEEDWEFPPPVGRRKVHLLRHEEVATLPLRLGKPVGWVDYKHAINRDLVLAISALHGLGFFSPDHVVKVRGRSLPFREAFLATFPEPSTLIDVMTGALVILAEVQGVQPDGRSSTVRVWVLAEHREANRRRSITAEYFLTAASAATAMILIGTGKAPRSGVLSPEELPPDIVLPELADRGIRFHVEERAG